MFTGLIEEIGTVVGLESLGDSVRLTVRGPVVTTDAGHGDSIAVNGCCLTVMSLSDDTFAADVMAESLQRTSLGDLAAGSVVNLERAVAAGARLGGHIVQGHVDGTGTLLDRTPSAHWEILRFSLPAEISRYLVEKGSITVDGVSSKVTVARARVGSMRGIAVRVTPSASAATSCRVVCPPDRAMTSRTSAYSPSRT